MPHKGRAKGNKPVSPEDLAALDKVAPRRAKRSAKNLYGLTSKQETFASLVVDGYSYVAAYRAAYDVQEDAKPSTHWRQGYDIANKPEVAARINQLQHELNEQHRALGETRAARVTAALEGIMSSAKTDSARLRAAELLGKTVGLFAEAAKDDKTAASVADLERQLADLLTQNAPAPARIEKPPAPIERDDSED